MADFSSAWAKLRRAGLHIRELESMQRAYSAARPFDLELQSDATSVWAVARLREQFPAELPLVLGDALTNLRASLDHAAVAVSSPGYRRGFPIVVRSGKPVHLDGESAAVHALVNAVQPRNQSRPTEDPLQILNELVNDDKHARLTVVAVSALQSLVFLDGPGMRLGGQSANAQFKDGGIVANWPFSEAQELDRLSVATNYVALPYVVRTQPGSGMTATLKTPVVESMEWISRHIESAVLRPLAALS